MRSEGGAECLKLQETNGNGNGTDNRGGDENVEMGGGGGGVAKIEEKWAAGVAL